MARKTTGPRYFDSKGGYYCTINGDRHCLAKGAEDDPEVKDEAERRYHELMLTSPEQRIADRITCRQILTRYLAWARNNLKPASVSIKQQLCGAFCEALGNVQIRSLRLHMATDWLGRMQEDRPHPTWGLAKWSPSTVRIAVQSVKAMLNWAVEQQLITSNPLARLKKPRASSRAPEQLLSEEGHQGLLAKANPALRDLLIALNDTGARPGEIVAVEAKDFRPDMAAWVLQEHKSERTGRPRVIYLPQSVLEITRRRVAEFPSGPIFRNTRGRPWDIKSVETWFQRVRKQLGLGPVTPYSYRHKFATEFLLAGGSMAVLAELLDNSIVVIEHHYGHIREHGPQLRKHLTDFRPGPQSE